ncbi:MAG: divergent polysaccharide deacetylase family protein [Gemmatimonadota bacterium]|nr:divergent polysaccharide deacetylase family protein [Gemmatimonadota bacterium]
MSLRLWTLAFVLALAVGLAGWMRWREVKAPASVQEIALNQQAQWRTLPADPLAFADSVASRAPAVLKDLGVPEGVASIRRSQAQTGGTARWVMTTDVPDGLPLAVFNLQLTRLARRLGGDVVEAVEDRNGARLSISVGLDGVRTNQFILKRNARLNRLPGRVAIIVVDFGYQDEALIRGFCALKQTITFSIFPGREKTAWIAEQAAAAGHGVMAYLSMEPLDYPRHDPGPNAVLMGHPPEKIRTLIRAARANLPQARGINNHMGSRLTEDPAAIRSVLKEIDRHGLFFVDSFTSPRSVAWSVAEEMGMPAGRNAMFLDRRETQESVEQSVEALAKMAGVTGTVIGIGSARPATLAALERVLPELEKQGIEFVSAGKAVR